MNHFLLDRVLEWGIKASEVNKAYKDADYEASHFGKENDSEYIQETMSTILDREDKLFVDNFIKSKELNLSKFIEDLFDEPIIEDMMSTDFASNQRPEDGGHKFYTHGIEDIVSDENQDENNKEAGL